MNITTSDLNDKLQMLASSVDIASLTQRLQSITMKARAADLTEMGKNLGEVKGGFSSISQNVDNLSEKLAGQLDANGYPSGGVNTATITRVDKSIQKSVPAFSTNISAQSASISALVSSGHGTSAAVKSGTTPNAVAIENVNAGLMEDIISDGSPEAIAGTLKKLGNVNPADIKSLLQQIGNSSISDIIDTATADILGIGFPAEISNILKLAQTQVSKTLSLLDGGNLLKAIVENSTNDIQNAISGLNTNLSTSKLKSYTNSVIAGNGLKVSNDLVKQVTVPTDLSKELNDIGFIHSAKFNSLSDLQDFVSAAKRTELSPKATVGLNELEKSLTTLNDDIANRDTSLSASISSSSSISSNPIVDPSLYTTKSTRSSPATASTTQVSDGSTSTTRAGFDDSTFPFLNSEEEIVRYLQGATREITTVVWHWTANYTNQGYIGSDQINHQHVTGRGWSAIGYHFVVKRDGSIQIGRSINKTGAHVLGFNTRSIGISFVAGYKCTSDKYSGVPPYSEIGEESITLAQHQAFKRFMSSWYKVFPGGCAYGHVDFPNNKGKVDPGFDVSKRVYEQFGKKNVGHPKKDNAILTVAEINEKRQFRNIG